MKTRSATRNTTGALSAQASNASEPSTSRRTSARLQARSHGGDCSREKQRKPREIKRKATRTTAAAAPQEDATQDDHISSGPEVPQTSSYSPDTHHDGGSSISSHYPFPAPFQFSREYCPPIRKWTEEKQPERETVEEATSPEEDRVFAEMLAKYTNL